MQVRQFQETDFNELIKLAHEMQDESPVYSQMPLDETKLIKLGESIVNDKKNLFGMVVMSEGKIVGFMIAAITPYYFSNKKIAQDLALYVVPKMRTSKAAILLIWSYEKWAKDNGAQKINLGVTTGFSDERIATLYESIGYKRCGILCSKDVSQVTEWKGA